MAEILVVDDDLELRETMAEILRKEGFVVTEAQNADLALSMPRSSPFDLILLDMVMPGTDGMAALPLLKRRFPRAKLIVITAFSSVHNAVQAMKQGADDYIAKPFKIEALLLSVRKNLEEARFLESMAGLDMDGAFHALANVIRRNILRLLRQEGGLRFMDLTRSLGIADHTKVNFHLKVLKEAGLIANREDRAYALTKTGNKIAECLSYLVGAQEGW